MRALFLFALRGLCYHGVMIKIQEAKRFTGHRFGLKFSDGSTGVADLTEFLTKEPFLGIAECFDAWYLENGVIEWPHARVRLPDGGTRYGLGIPPEALYALAHGLKIPETFEDALKNEQAVLARASDTKKTAVAHAAKRFVDALDAGDIEIVPRDMAVMVKILDCMIALRGALNLIESAIPNDDQRSRVSAVLEGRLDPKDDRTPDTL